jgi:subtilisin family serine protease
MMEIVQDIAPGAQLYFATANGGQPHMAANIAALAAQGCSIIVDDITYFAEGAFQDGPIAQAVNAFVAGGGIYFSSAANSGNKDSGTSGTWEGDFIDGGLVSGVVGGSESGTGNFHNFGGQNFDVMTVASGFISLKWSDPLGASTNDYDLFVLNSTGTVIKGFSATRQTGTQDPYEIVVATTSGGNYVSPAVGDQVVVVNYGPAPGGAPPETQGFFIIGATRALRVDTNRGQLSINTAGSTFGHNGGQSTTTMAATYWNSARIGTKPFNGANNPIEVFSSDGPRKIFYNPNGTPITPGNVLFGTNGGTTIPKPDLTAADGVTAKTPGFNPFYGTSAAAPHAAGIAALVKSVNPGLTGAQIRQIMINTALDNMAPGFDRDGGNGVTMALPAVLAAPVCRGAPDCSAEP